MTAGTRFDIAVSFAREQRPYVEATVAAARALEIRVFYDKDVGSDWWGRNFIVEQRKVYGDSTLFVVPFISREYLARPFPMDELSSALVKAVEQRDPYILPVLVGEVVVPAELLSPHVGFLRAEEYTPGQLADQMKAKVEAARITGHQPKDVGVVVDDALQLRLPRAVPTTFSKYRELEAVLGYLGDRLEVAGRHLESAGYVATVRRGPDRISMVVERDGRTEYALRVAVGGQGMGEDKLTFTLGADISGLSAGMAAWLEPFYDRDSQQVMLRLVDFSLLDRLGGREQILSRELLFHRLWKKMIEELERRH